MKPITLYPIHEMFHTFQGEGVHMGESAFFIRLFGCPVQCPWCDSAGTWHPKYVPKDIARLSAEDILHKVYTDVEFVVITGGEPCVHDLRDLTDILHQVGMEVHLETSGSFPIRGEFDFITVSPKKWKLPLFESIKKAHEFKFIIEHPEDINFYTNLLDRLYGLHRITAPFWLHPEWSHQNDPVVLQAISRAILQRDVIYRAGWQLHKLYKVDLMDSGSRPAVPLGGDVKKGF